MPKVRGNSSSGKKSLNVFFFIFITQKKCSIKLNVKEKKIELIERSHA